MKDPETSQPAQGEERFRRDHEDFASLYANHVYYELSPYDLKMIFGQTDMSTQPGKEIIEQHTAITVPWVQVKLMIYFLQVNLAIHEAISGKVHVPPSVLSTVGKPSGILGISIDEDLQYLTELWQAFQDENRTQS